MHARDPRRVYRQQQLDGARPEDLLLAVYRHAIGACGTGRRGLVIRALEELIGGLDLERGELSIRLLRLYEYLVHEARAGRLEEVERHLRELLTAWEAGASPPSGPALVPTER